MIRSNDILTKVFPTTKFREGYEVEEVDSFLDALAEAYRQVEQGADRFPVTADVIVEKQFTATRFSDGYDQVAVDDYLDAIAADIQARQGRSFVSDGGADAQARLVDPDAADIAEKQLKVAAKKLRKKEASAAEVAEMVATITETEQITTAQESGGDPAGAEGGRDDSAFAPAAIEPRADDAATADADAQRDLGGLAAYEVISKLQFARIKVRGMARDRVVVVGPDGTRYPIAAIEPGEDSVTIQLGDA